ncbi:MAG TPA: thiamine pyrophosphate-binding protein [Gemmatimonadales bacterium]|nr:thiamine pyrophosphate-binding protein [Gemmatimonadales bacterium]
MNGGDLIAAQLQREGVRAVFTLCGGHISPILVAAKRRGIRVLDVRDEASAVFAADAVARLTGTPGVAVVTAGPGAANSLTAVANARQAESPLVVIGGSPPTILRGRGALQDVDHQAMFAPHVKSATHVRRVRDLAPAVAAAFSVAPSGSPGPAFVECPVDLLYDQHLVREMYGVNGPPPESFSGRVQRWWLERHLRRLFADVAENGVEPRRVATPEPSPGELARAADLLLRAERPVMVLGSQAVMGNGRVEHLIRAIEQLGIPTYLSGMARGLLGPAHALSFRHRRGAALKEADAVLLCGAPLDFRLDYGRQIGRRTRIIAVNLNRRALTKNRRPTHGVVSQPGRFLIELAARLGGARSAHAAWLDTLRARERERDAEIEALAARPADGVNPIALCRAIDRALADDSIIVADGGDFVGTAAYTVRPRRPLSWLDPGPFGTLGAGGGFALGARVARPTAEVWILYGDGAAAFSIAEFDTFVRHGLPVIAVVGNDGAWTQIARGQIQMLGDDVGTTLRRTAYHRVAEGYGGVGLEISEPNHVDAVLAEAKRLAREGKPVLVNAIMGTTEFRSGSISL